MHGGKWAFMKISDGSVVTAEVNDTTPSKIAAAIDAAATALSTTVDDVSYRGIHDYSTDNPGGITASQINHNPTGHQGALH